MAVSRARRQFLQHVGAGLAVPGVLSESVWAAGPENRPATISVQATTTNLVSDSERMISYRHQQHMAQTADGALHIVINCGTLGPGPGLSLFSSYDGGTTWQFMQNFAGTDTNCSADVALSGNYLSIVYYTTIGQVMFTQLSYDGVARTWAVVTLELAYASSKWSALNPAMAVDDLGTVWVGFTETNAKGGNLRVVNRPAGGNVWTDPGLVFGPIDKPAVERSARPVCIAGAMGMVWTVHQNTYWSKRTNGAPSNSPWTQSTIYAGNSGKAIVDPYASHFNVTTDLQGGIHLISVENYDVLYFGYSADTDTWSSPQQVDDSRKVAYAQIGVVNGKLAVAYSVQQGAGSVTVSPDLGTTWAPYAALKLVPAVPGINYNTARVEFPVNCNGAMPVLQQYAIGNTQRLMLFTLPGP